MNAQQAVKNSRKYSIIRNAIEAAESQHYYVPVLLGEDGLYVVPANNREASILLKAGYEAA